MLPLKDIYAQAIELWVYQKLRDEERNPADGIVFALTNTLRPRDIPEPGNTVQLCEALARMIGSPPLTDDEKKSIQLAGILAYEQYRRGGGRINWARRLVWINRVGYVLGAVALGINFSWWIIILIGATWSAMGAARVSSQSDDQPTWATPAHILLHLSLLVTLYAVSLIKIVQRLT